MCHVHPRCTAIVPNVCMRLQNPNQYYFQVILKEFHLHLRSWPTCWHMCVFLPPLPMAWCLCSLVFAITSLVFNLTGWPRMPASLLLWYPAGPLLKYCGICSSNVTFWKKFPHLAAICYSPPWRLKLPNTHLECCNEKSFCGQTLWVTKNGLQNIFVFCKPFLEPVAEAQEGACVWFESVMFCWEKKWKYGLW